SEEFDPVRLGSPLGLPSEDADTDARLQGFKARPAQGAFVNEDVLVAAIGYDEAESLVGVIEFDRPLDLADACRRRRGHGCTGAAGPRRRPGPARLAGAGGLTRTPSPPRRGGWHRRFGHRVDHHDLRPL